jgi:hypothetical protein
VRKTTLVQRTKASSTKRRWKQRGLRYKKFCKGYTDHKSKWIPLTKKLLRNETPKDKM